MGVTSRIPVSRILSAIETHPQLRDVRVRLEGMHIPQSRISALIRSLIVHAVEDFGDAYLGDMAARLRRIDGIRARIAGAVDHVVAEGALPPELSRAQLSDLFDNLQSEMAGLQSARLFAEQHHSSPALRRILDAIEPTEPVSPSHARAFGVSDDPLQGVVGARPPGLLRDAYAALRTDHPRRFALFDDALREHGDLLGLAVLAETESAQAAALRDLRDALPGMTDADFAELREAVTEMGRARSRAAATSAGAARVRAQRVADLPQPWRDAIGADNTLLGPLAEQFPGDLQELWDAWNAGGRTQKFRNYVHGEMGSGRRPALAEWQAAHDLANDHGVRLLKDPAAFDPAQPNLRRVNPREGGTDLLGVRPDGEIWYVDDKSHRLSAGQRAAGQTGINLSSVSAFEENLARNMADDVAEIEAGFARARAAGREPDPVAVEAAGRLRRCADELAAETQGWTREDFRVPDKQARVAAILNRHRVRLKISSTMGDVTGVTSTLRGLGIEPLPPVVRSRP